MKHLIKAAVICGHESVSAAEYTTVCELEFYVPKGAVQGHPNVVWLPQHVTCDECIAWMGFKLLEDLG